MNDHKEKSDIYSELTALLVEYRKLGIKINEMWKKAFNKFFNADHED